MTPGPVGTVTVASHSHARPGSIAAMGVGDYVTVMPSAVQRPDWAAMAQALATAFARGADVHMYGGSGG